MLVAVVLLFIICWTPLLVTEALTAFGYLPVLHYGYLKPMRMTFNAMAYLNSCVNPIVYGFMSKNFRESFLNALCLCRHSYPIRQMSFTQTRTTSVSLGRSFSVSTTTYWLEALLTRFLDCCCSCQQVNLQTEKDEERDSQRFRHFPGSKKSYADNENACWWL